MTALATLVWYDVLRGFNCQNNFPSHPQHLIFFCPLFTRISVHDWTRWKSQNRSVSINPALSSDNTPPPKAKLLTAPPLMTIIISSPFSFLSQRQHSFPLCDVINQDFVRWEGKNGCRKKRTKKKYIKGRIVYKPSPHSSFVCTLYGGNLQVSWFMVSGVVCEPIMLMDT